MAPVWLTVAAWVDLPVCFCCASIIACDIAFNHRPQPIGVTNVVSPIAALFFGPFALALYWRWGRAARTTMASMPMSRAVPPQAAPGERARPWCCSFHSDDDPGGSAQLQSWLEARFRLSERDLRDG
jgi:hypothetical protein